ncbi:hypothetical protein PR202_gb09992 [Eleusine coracana subsp. coracana]|uniref:WRC domain-containing protein n=1 Tax=Eleusine coracana subsp. coracana TaxID=191504 RepID=A0AAV5EJ92_ELECO|nr:hypothetical protein PR202_gb09992 [Eleusine coracana subsp. coracana]
MRIRRRPQGQSVSSLLPSDPPAPQPPPNAASPRDHHHLQVELLPSGVEKKEELHYPNAATTADLGDDESSSAALLPLLPQGNVVECSRGLGAQRGPAADGHSHRRLDNNGYQYHHVPDEPATIKTGERLANGVSPAIMPVTAVPTRVQKKEEVINIKDDSSSGGGASVKKRRGPAVLLEGSRCSRVNGRGWRCSQPTLVGYSLCEHHLGKGRMRAAAAAGRASAAGQKLGRTEHQHQKSAAAVTVASVTSAAPKADVAPPPSMSHC